MNETFEAAAEVHKFCAGAGWKFCFIGARHGKKLDRELIFRELTPLLELKKDASAGERLRKIFAEIA